MRNARGEGQREHLRRGDRIRRRVGKREMINEDESGVYGVGASGSMQQIPYGSMTFRIAFPCGPENVESLIKYALEQVETIKSGEILEEDLNKIKEFSVVDWSR